MKKLVIADDLKPLMMNAMTFLQRSEIAVLTAGTNDGILKHHMTENADLIVTKVDLPGLASEALINTIRRSENMRKVSIILLCEDTPDHRRRCLLCSVNAVVTRPIDPVLFAGKVHDLLHVAPRLHYRVVLNVAVEGRHENKPFLCSSQNISTKGILIRTMEKLGQDWRVTCSLCLPDGKRVTASGEIVRFVSQTAEPGANYYGIRFTALASDAETAIAAFVEKELRRKL